MTTTVCSLTHLQEEDTTEDVCLQIINQWTEYSRQSSGRQNTDDGNCLFFSKSIYHKL